MLKSIIYTLFLFPSLVLASPVLNETTLRNLDYTKPVVITKNMRAAVPRQDIYDGIGMCAKTAKYQTASGNDLKSPVEASILNDALINETFEGRVYRNGYIKSKVFSYMDFRSNVDGGNSKGDLQDEENWLDDTITPYQSYQTTMKLRGYINIDSPKTMTFGLNTSTGGFLIIAGKPILYSDPKTPNKSPFPQEVTQQVTFESEGMYAIEAVYYQNTQSISFFEIGAMLGTPTNPGYQFGYSTSSLGDIENNKLVDWRNQPIRMTALSKVKLYATIDGEQTYQCSLCSDNTQCAQDQQCLDGICQNTATACNTNARCGASCNACPSPKDVCGKGKCVQCISENECKFTETCDMSSNKCVPRPPECTQDSQCQLPGSTSTYVCDTSIGKCAIKKPDCTATTDCKLNEFCNSSQKCEVKSTAITCDKDDACPLNDYCDVSQHVCVGLTLGGCRKDVQCFSGYKCDTVIHTCVSTTVTPDPSKPSPTGTNQPDGTSIGNTNPANGKTGHGCNQNGRPLPISTVLFNVLIFGLAFRNRFRKLLQI